MMVPQRHELSKRVRQDLLFRLRWDVLCAVDDVKIATGPNDHPSTIPLFGSSFADEALADPPIHRVHKVWMGDCMSKRDYDYGPEEYRYQPPAPLTITNEDGSGITIGQFVRKVHVYLNENMEELKKVKGELYGREVIRADGSRGRDIIYGQPYLPPDIKLFFKRVHAVSVDEEVWISVDVWASGEMGYSDEWFWGVQLKQAQWCEQKRLD